MPHCNGKPAITLLSPRVFGGVAQAYAQHSHWQRARGLMLLDLAAPQSAQTALDLGCGTGELTVELARRVGHRGRVYGIDPDRERLNRAQALAAATGENVEYHWATAENMDPIPTSSVDLIYSNYAVHWVRDLPAMLGEVERVLKPGGRFVAEFAATPVKLFDFIMRLMPEARAFSTDHTFLDDGDWREAIGACAFGIRSLDWLDLALDCKSLSELYNWLEATSHGSFRPHLLSAGDRAGLEAAYAGRISIPVKALNMVLQRL